MSRLVFLLSNLLCVAHCQIGNPSLPIRLPSIRLNTSCPLHRDHVLRELVRETLDVYHNDDSLQGDSQQHTPPPNPPTSSVTESNDVTSQPNNAEQVPQCFCGGDGGWTRAVYLNMADMNQQCPNNWTLITTPVRGCGHTSRAREVCDSVTYPVHGLTYSQVCGRILACQKGYMTAFYNNIERSQFTLEGAYLSGASLTHRPPESRQHIWSFAGGVFELANGYSTPVQCPCSFTNYTYQTPSFVDNDYFCESGNPGPSHSYYTYYTDDPLWDGQGCSNNSTCCEYNDPPWFCTSLPQPTNEDLEIRSCHTFVLEGEDTVISSIDIFMK